MAGTFSYIQTQPLSFAQKLVQARVWAQGLTLASLVGMAAITQIPSAGDKIIEQKAHANEHSWMDYIPQDEKDLSKSSQSQGKEGSSSSQSKQVSKCGAIIADVERGTDYFRFLAEPIKGSQQGVRQVPANSRQLEGNGIRRAQDKPDSCLTTPGNGDWQMPVCLCAIEKRSAATRFSLFALQLLYFSHVMQVHSDSRVAGRDNRAFKSLCGWLDSEAVVCVSLQAQHDILPWKRFTGTSFMGPQDRKASTPCLLFDQSSKGAPLRQSANACKSL